MESTDRCFLTRALLPFQLRGRKLKKSRTYCPILVWLRNLAVVMRILCWPHASILMLGIHPSAIFWHMNLNHCSILHWAVMTCFIVILWTLYVPVWITDLFTMVYILRNPVRTAKYPMFHDYWYTQMGYCPGAVSQQFSHYYLTSNNIFHILLYSLL